MLEAKANIYIALVFTSAQHFFFFAEASLCQCKFYGKPMGATGKNALKYLCILTVFWLSSILRDT